MKLNVEEICQKNNISDDDLKCICKRFLVKEGYDFRKFWINAVEFEHFSNKNYGFLAYHLKLTITVSPKNVTFFDEPESDDDDDEKKLTFFVKLLPRENSGQMDYVEAMNIFEKETDLYQFLIPRLQDMAIGANEWAAQSYLSKDDKVLILEDLRLDGFQVPYKCKMGMFDLTHLLVAVDVLARFHASSWILENRSRESIIQTYPSTLNETSYPDDERCVRYKGLTNAIHTLNAMVKEIPKYRDDPKALEIIEEQLPETVRSIIQFAKTSTKFRNCLSHGDLWANNFLFMYESEEPDSSDDESNTESCHEEQVQVEINQEDKDPDSVSTVLKVLDEQIESSKTIIMGPSKRLRPVDARLVDFQLARYSPPALDIVTLLHLTTTKAFREKHQEEILERYYESLTVELDRLGLDVCYELPKEQYLETLEYYTVAGKIEACLFSQMTLLPEDQMDLMFSDGDQFDKFIMDGETRAEVCLKIFREDRKYRERMTELLIELIDHTILEITVL